MNNEQDKAVKNISKAIKADGGALLDEFEKNAFEKIEKKSKTFDFGPGHNALVENCCARYNIPMNRRKLRPVRDDLPDEEKVPEVNAFPLTKAPVVKIRGVVQPTPLGRSR